MEVVLKPGANGVLGHTPGELCHCQPLHSPLQRQLWCWCSCSQAGPGQMQCLPAHHRAARDSLLNNMLEWSRKCFVTVRWEEITILSTGRAVSVCSVSVQMSPQCWGFGHFVVQWHWHGCSWLCPLSNVHNFQQQHVLLSAIPPSLSSLLAFFCLLRPLLASSISSLVISVNVEMFLPFYRGKIHF